MRLVANVISDVRHVQLLLCMVGNCYILSIWFNSRWMEIGGLNITFLVACFLLPSLLKCGEIFQVLQCSCAHGEENTRCSKGSRWEGLALPQLPLASRVHRALETCKHSPRVCVARARRNWHVHSFPLAFIFLPPNALEIALFMGWAL